MGKVKAAVNEDTIKRFIVSIPYGKGKEQHFVLQIYYIP